MKYLPFENIIYQTKLSPEEALDQLSKNLEPEQFIRMGGLFRKRDYKKYEGYIHGNTFSIKRIINYRNSFLPQINGIVTKNSRGTQIHVKMRLNIFAMVFMIIWCGGVGAAFLFTLAISFSQSHSEPVYLIPFLMLLFGYGMTTGGFKYESIRTKKQLAELFEAIIEKE